MKQALFSLIGCLLLTACETPDPTQAVFDNAYPASEAGAAGSVVLYKGWWSVAQLTEPVEAGAESDPVRIVKGTDFAYALLALGWDRESGAPPSILIPVRTRTELTAMRGDTLHIEISDATTLGNCAAGEPLAQTVADLVTQRIFSAEFENVTYDAATCMGAPISDGGAPGPAGDAGATGE